MKILITGAHGDIACSVGKIIKSEFNKFIIFGMDIESNGPGDYLFKKIYKTTSSYNEYYLKTIKKIYQKFDLIIPCTEPEINYIVKKKLYKIYPILINNPEIILKFNSKVKTLQFLKSHFKILSSNFFYKKKNIKFPFFLKKNLGYGNKGYLLIKNYSQLKKKINNKNWIGQEYLSGKDNEFTCSIIRLKNFEKVLILNRKLHKAGYTYFAKVVKNKILENILINFSRKINLHGCINVQLKIIKGRFKVFDINTRLSSTVMMRNIIGFKDCVWWIKDFLKINFSKKIKIKKNISIFKDFTEKIIYK
jgi:carbamoyl-phosphate synthase large subunit